MARSPLQKRSQDEKDDHEEADVKPFKRARKTVESSSPPRSDEHGEELPPSSPPPAADQEEHSENGNNGHMSDDDEVMEGAEGGGGGDEQEVEDGNGTLNDISEELAKRLQQRAEDGSVHLHLLCHLTTSWVVLRHVERTRRAHHRLPSLAPESASSIAQTDSCPVRSCGSRSRTSSRTRMSSSSPGRISIWSLSVRALATPARRDLVASFRRSV
jgi:hypothetical protein